MKKILAILVALSMLVCLSSCAKISVTVPSKTDINNSTNNNNNDLTDSQLPGDIGDDFNNQGGDVQTVVPDSPSTGEISDNPAEWTVAQIVQKYKSAAAKTHNNVTSHQDMTLRDKSLKATGTNGKPIADSLLGMTESVMKTALKNNSTDFKGITGGHQNLLVSDVQSAKAYKNGDNIVIEMQMKEQIDKGNGKMTSGTVGHAISVVGDIDSVIGQFSSLGVETDLADENCTLHYKKPVVKVAINSNGYIVNGTWSYYVDVTLKNLTITAFGISVPVAIATSVIDFVVILNGGFKG